MNELEASSWDFLTGDARTDHENVRLIMDTVKSLYAAPNATGQLQEAVRRAVEVTHADQGFLLVPQGDELVLSEFVDRRNEGGDPKRRYSQTVVNTVWRTGIPERWNGFPPHIDPEKTLPAIGMQSGMAVRLDSNDRPVAVLYVHAASRRREYGASELKVFRALATLIAAALETRRLTDANHAKKVMEDQIRLAREVQQRFTPYDVQLPPGVEVATHADVCLHLSGDYCDVIPRRDGAIALVIGDVSGKGIRTALYSAETRALVRRHMRDGRAPDVTLSSVNELLTEDMASQDFMSLFVGVFDPETRAFRYASAGHNPPLLRHADGTLVELERTGPALGWWPDATFSLSDPVGLAGGDVLVLYTDGIYECHDARHVMYGEERFRRSLGRHAAAGGDAESIRHGLIADLDAFLNGAHRDDDVTCIVLRVRPDAA